jgi:RNA polymerase sigma factor for flagellar operon FliA
MEMPRRPRDRGRDEEGLWLRWRRRGSLAARNRLFEIHWVWASADARRYALRRGFDPSEVFGSVAYAVLECVARFDPAKGVPFRAFAAPRVSGALRDAGRFLFRDSRPSQAAPGRPSSCGPGDREAGPSPRRAPGSARAAWGTADPFDAAVERETRALILDAMPDARTREVARRRFWLEESVDEIGLALGLGKSVIANCLQLEVLPAARRCLRKMGLAPSRPLRSVREERSDVPGAGMDGREAVA